MYELLPFLSVLHVLCWNLQQSTSVYIRRDCVWRTGVRCDLAVRGYLFVMGGVRSSFFFLISLRAQITMWAVHFRGLVILQLLPHEICTLIHVNCSA